MKSLLVILFLFFVNIINATTYYVSTKDGNDGNKGTSAAAPWQTISKVNSFAGNLRPGDEVLLKRGDTFFGSLSPSVSGSSGSNILLGAYGSGNKPVMSALQTLSFSGGSGNIYTSSSFNPQSAPYLLLLDGVLQQIGRYPNASNDGPDYGYLRAKGNVTSGPVMMLTDDNWGNRTDKRPSNSIDYTTAQIAYRCNRFLFITQPIISASFSGNAATFTTKDYRPHSPFGFFLQNNIAFLDQQGEWCYDNSAKTASIYLKKAPSNYTVEIPVFDDIINMGNVSFWTIDNISFTGANGNAIDGGGSNINITNCDFKYCGNAALGSKATNLLVANNTVDGMLHYGMQVRGSGPAMITDNLIQNTNVYLGMGLGGNTGGSGMDIGGQNKTVQYNTIINSSYAGVNFNPASHQHFYYNIIRQPCMRIDDGGAFYTVNQSKHFNNTDIAVKQNIIKDFTGTPTRGTWSNNNMTMSLYGDQYSSNITWDGNITIGGANGLFLNDPISIIIINNVFWNQSNWNVRIRNNHTDIPLVNNVVNNNVFFSNAASPAVFFVNSKTGESIGSFGTFNSNYYVTPYSNNAKYFKDDATSYTIDQWQAKYGHERNSHLSPKFFTPDYDPSASTKLVVNDTKNAQTYTIPGTWIGARGTSYKNSITLQPFTAEVLIKGD